MGSDFAREPAAPVPAPAPPLRIEHRTHRTIARQPLHVGAANDPAEREADSIAATVIEALERRVDEPLDARPARFVDSRIRRASVATSVPAVGLAGGEAPDEVVARIEATRGWGERLQRSIRSRMEGALGVDLDGVRVHQGGEAAHLNRSLGARAFTTGSDIYFGAGEYRPSTRSGQRLLAHELAHTVQQSPSIGRVRRAPSPVPAGSRMIRRLAFNQNPTTWPAPATLNRKRSGEGQAGVFFANDAGAVFAPGTVVIKPVASSGEIAYANKFLHEGMGFDAPDQVEYTKASAEGQALSSVLTTPGVVGVRTPTEAADQLANATQIIVMSMVQGKSIQTLDDNEATEFLRNEIALEQVGRLMVSDAFLGNSDRLIGGRVNLGNFFYAAAGALGRVKTIDNDSRFTRATYNARGNLDGEMRSKMDYLDQLTTVDGKNMWITQFMNKMKQAHRNNNGAMNELNTNPGWIMSRIANGIDNAMTDIVNIFTNNMDLVRAVGTMNDPDSAGKRQVDEAKGLAHYVKARSGGDDPATATEKLKTYLEYRTKRNKFPKGFKWMVKVGMDRGFD